MATGIPVKNEKERKRKKPIVLTYDGKETASHILEKIFIR
jgi:hypothetical protein